MAQCLSFFSPCSTITTGCYLYTDIKRTATVGAGWVSDGTTSYQVNSSGMIIGTSPCVFNYRSYLLGSDGSTGTVYWKDCNGITQSVYNDGQGNWNNVVACALEGSFTAVGSNLYSGTNFDVYMSIGYPCDCNNLNACHSYTITSTRNNAGAPGSIIWVDCNGGYHNVPGLPYGQTMTVCAKKGRVWNFSTANDGIGHIGSQGVTSYTGGGTRGIVDNGVCLPNGTFINTVCRNNYDLYYIYANGAGGTYETLIESNSATCGYTVSDYYCSCFGYDCDPYPNPCYYYACTNCTPANQQ
jgi:hypothetical protein